LVNGLILAEELSKYMYATGENLQAILAKLDREYDELLKNRRPKEILLG
jgi:hypothetical protein